MHDRDVTPDDDMSSPHAAVGTAEVAQLFATEYAFGTPDECRLLHSGLNDTYAVHVGDRTYALRVRGRDKWWIAGEDDLRFELELLDHLRSEGVPVSHPLPRRGGDPLGRLVTLTGDRHYTAFSWADGVPGHTEVLTKAQAYKVGETLAAIHVAADGFQPAQGRDRYTLGEQTLLDRWLEQLRPSLRTDPTADVTFIMEQIADIRRRIRAFDPGPGAWGIVHGDVQGLNHNFAADGEITWFNFDLCGYSWRAYDIAV